MKNKDFTFSTYEQLLKELHKSGYPFLTLEEYFTSYIHPVSSSPIFPFVILRHDVDRKPQNALKIAEIENELGIKATYYFRIVKESYDEKIIRVIADLGHEIGYHYEDLALAKGDFDKAIYTFEKNLEKLRKLYPVKTICMHGSPLSKWDNRLLWKKYNYRDFGTVFEPYFDLDFNEVFYITDASRSWNNEKVSIRDKVKTNFNIQINSTNDILNLIQSEDCPLKIMINIHPHNWAKSSLEWIQIYFSQSCKNIIKRTINKRNYL